MKRQAGCFGLHLIGFGLRLFGFGPEESDGIGNHIALPSAYIVASSVAAMRGGRVQLLERMVGHSGMI